MERFDKFTDRARKVLTLAQDEAQRFNHNYIGTEHLLLGLVREGEGVAARVLENMNVELAKIRTAVEYLRQLLSCAREARVRPWRARFHGVQPTSGPGRRANRRCGRRINTRGGL